MDSIQITPLVLPEVLLITHQLFNDHRGTSFESYNYRDLLKKSSHAINVIFVQENQSFSKLDVLRGLHYQLAPHAQGKLVRVLVGEICDVVVDVRQKSPSLGKWVMTRLNASCYQEIWVPPGFAHGFLTLSPEGSVVSYKITDYYAPQFERCLKWDDPYLSIPWPVRGTNLPILSEKDALATTWTQAELFN